MGQLVWCFANNCLIIVVLPQKESTAASRTVFVTGLLCLTVSIAGVLTAQVMSHLQ